MVPLGPLAVAGCVTLVEAPDGEAVIRAFGADPAEVVPGPPFTGSDTDDPDRDQFVAVQVIDGGLAVLECNGYEGSHVAAEASRGGCAVSVFWNVNAHTRFSYAVDGRLLVGFDALSPEHRYGTEPDALVELMTGLFTPDLHWIESMFTLAARTTGLTLPADWLERDSLTVPVRPWLRVWDTGRPWTEVHPLNRLDQPLAQALVATAPAAQRRVALVAARRAAGTADLTPRPEPGWPRIPLPGVDPDAPPSWLAEHPAVAVTLAAVDAGRLADIPRAELAALFAETSRWARVNPPWPRVDPRTVLAIRAVRSAAITDPLGAAMEAVEAALRAVPDPGELRAVLDATG
jgi:Family of unknown function (DUF6461)